MERIASFCVDHTRLERGMYLSRQDGDVLTWDIRMKKPNQGDYLTTAVAHTPGTPTALWPILRAPCPVPARWSAAITAIWICPLPRPRPLLCCPCWKR